MTNYKLPEEIFHFGEKVDLRPDPTYDPMLYELLDFYDRAFKSQEMYIRILAYHKHGPERGRKSVKICRLNGVPINHETTVLNVGCGTTGELLYLASEVKKLFLLDLDQLALKMSLARYHDNKLEDRIVPVHYSGSTFPFRDGRFNLVISNGVLEHVENPEYFISEIGRVLAPGGFAYLMFQNKYDFSRKEEHTGIYGLNWLPRKISSYIVNKAFNVESGYNIYPWSLFRVKKLLKNSGLSYKISPDGIECLIPKPYHLILRLMKATRVYDLFCPNFVVLLKKD